MNLEIITMTCRSFHIILFVLFNNSLDYSLLSSFLPNFKFVMFIEGNGVAGHSWYACKKTFTL
jgi:uncharacterized membrane protein YwaF